MKVFFLPYNSSPIFSSILSIGNIKTIYIVDDDEDCRFFSEKQLTSGKYPLSSFKPHQVDLAWYYIKIMSIFGAVTSYRIQKSILRVLLGL